MANGNRIDLTRLQLQWDFDRHVDDDTIDIYTRMGIRYPDKPLDHQCNLASLLVSDRDDPDDTAYQLAGLFIAAPQLLKAVKDTLETLKPVRIVQLEPLKAYLRECVSEAESGRGDEA